MKQPVIHIGYNKTGSTWLQEELFPRREIGFLSFMEMEARVNIYRSLVKQHALSFDGESVLGFYQQKIGSLDNKGLQPVFSCERFSGDPHSGGYDTKEIADRIKRLFPNARIILVVREQKSMLMSTFSQYIRAGGVRRLKYYMKPPKRGNRRVPMFEYEYFEYHHLVQYYQQLFGKENMLVLPFEWLKTDPERYIRTLVTFSGLEIDEATLSNLPFRKKVNRGYGAATLFLKRIYNRFFLDNGLNPGAFIHLPYRAEKWMVAIGRFADRLIPGFIQERQKKKRKDFIHKKCAGRYTKSNQILAEITGLDLKSLGYDC
ncbi:MAG: sulfotransferase [Bacteroidetes bacterium]|nr:sulfotransferase [Bacteroidota bacterium]